MSIRMALTVKDLPAQLAETMLFQANLLELIRALGEDETRPGPEAEPQIESPVPSRHALPS